MLLSLCCSVVIMLYCYCVALLLFVLSYVLIVCTVPLPPGVNPIAVDIYIYISILVGLFCGGTGQEGKKFRSLAGKKVRERGIESGIIYYK